MKGVYAMNRDVMVLGSVDVSAGQFSELAEWVLMIPDGHVDSARGKFILTEAAADAVIAEFVRRGRDHVIDYEHQTLKEFNSRPDGRAPAAGWMKELRYMSGVGIQARVHWQAEAAEMIVAGKYRFISPVIAIDKKTKIVARLIHAGLTNAPAIVNMPALIEACERVIDMTTKPTTAMKKKRLANAEHPEDHPAEDTGGGEDTGEGETASLTAQLLEAMGLGPEATIDELLMMIVKRFPEILQGPAEVEDAVAPEDAPGMIPNSELGDRVRKALGVKAGRHTELIAAIERTGQSDKSAVRALTERLKISEKSAKESARTLAEMDANNKIAVLVKAGKMTADMVKPFRELALSDPQQFDTLTATLTPRIPQGLTSAPSGDKSSMAQIVASARTEYQSDELHKKSCSERAFIRETLRESDVEVSDKQLDELVVA